jgi:parvulin-like peptidyl-prolyl isomerase
MSRLTCIISLYFVLLLMTSCGNDKSGDSILPTLVPTAVVATPITEAATNPPPAITPEEVGPTAVPPTATPMAELAAIVNGKPILLDVYERELARYEQTQTQIGEPPADNYQQVVLDALIERELIAQAAQAQGIQVTPEMVEAKLVELRAAAGESGNFEAWLEANQWTEVEFSEALRSEMVAEQLVLSVTQNAPLAVEQVHARYLQVDDATLAQTLLTRAQNGDDFAFLAEQNSLDRITAENGGDLGFFARGSLLVPEVEEAAFSLQPNELSDVIAVPNESGQMTYYLVQVIEREAQRPLSANMQYTVLQQLFADWLAQQWAGANIQRLVNTDA